ncbi:MAG TPA: preprotein translocase subunit SecY [Gemmataceae bacterium]|nr:preprotein translocase subunit SecY [Gemmataceae bacterium]
MDKRQVYVISAVVGAAVGVLVFWLASWVAAVAVGIATFGLAAMMLNNRTIVAIFSIPELRQKIFITVLFLVVYRIGWHVPLPFIDQYQMLKSMQTAQQSALGQVLGFVSMFSGGNLSNACIFGLGIMPYISSSIIFQLLGSVYPPLEKLQKEGESGRKKINEYTRYATVPICLVQSYFVVQHLMQPQGGGGLGWTITGYDLWYVKLTGVLLMTTGTVFLMWLGEQIDEYGIGNGISLIIMAGILARLPDATKQLLFDPSTGSLKESIFTLGGTGGADISFEKLLVLMVLFVVVVVAVVAITKGQRRIPTQSARHIRGRRVYGGTRNYLPLRVNQAGVMPVIFASSLLMVPFFLLNFLQQRFQWGWVVSLYSAFERQGYVYNVCYIALIIFFCYFWTALIFNPKDMANNLKDYGTFIPGYRPGKRTAEYLERVMLRITYVGAAFLCVIAIVPSVIQTTMGVDYRIASFYGGTGLLIVISVALDLVQKINSHLVMRNYPGLTED